MIDPFWKRIAGIHVDDDGTIGVVWLAHDEMSDTVHVYDAAVFRNEVRAVIAEALAARGRNIRLAYRKKDEPYAEKLRDAGLRLVPEACVDNDQMAEVMSREIWQKMRTSRFRVERRVFDWLQEFKRYDRDQNKVPREGFPLMSATRHAIEMLPYARAEKSRKRRKKNYPKLALV